MQKSITIYLALTLAFYACMDASADITGKKKKSAPERSVQQSVAEPVPADICYVLCDFSASQGASLQAVKDNALRIFQSAALNCKLRYYDISDNQFAPPFFEFDLLLKNTRRPSEREGMRQKKDSLRKVLDAALAKKIIPTASKNSCINRMFGNAVQALGNDPENKPARIWFIVLSDLLEDCTYDFGHLDIDNADYNRALKLLDNMQTPMFTLKEYKNVQVQLTACSGNNTVSSQQLFVFWKKLLGKYHYNLTIAVTPDLPYWIK